MKTVVNVGVSAKMNARARRSGFVPNTTTKKILDSALEDIKTNKNLVRFNSDAELDRYLLSV